MALKVLLADDSAAIKKVVQLSLQDLGLELKTVGSGKDALEIAKKFKPDIAFIDVLLPQKSGYDVASEMKKDNVLKKTPIVLLWSAFMAFDEEKYKHCGADSKLEKPFESAALRTLIGKLVPQSAGPMARNLDFPSVEFETPIGSVPPPKPKSSRPSDGDDITSTELHNLPPIPPVNPAKAQKNVPQAPKIPTAPARTPDPASWNSDSEWVKKDLGKFKVPIPAEEEPSDSVSFEYSDSKIVDTSFLFKPQDVSTTTDAKTPAADFSQKPSKELSLEELSDLKLETRQIIEKVVWKLVPEIASQIIKEELSRLLGEEK